MTAEYFKQHRNTLLNRDRIPWGKADERFKHLLMRIPRTHVQVLDSWGFWAPYTTEERTVRITKPFDTGTVYRVDPVWKGSAGHGYIDIKPSIGRDGDWIVEPPDGVPVDIHVSRVAVGYRDCIGLIYDGRLASVLRYVPIYGSAKKHIGYKPIVPDAVRFIKR